MDIDPDVRDILAGEIDALVERLGDDETRSAYAALADEVRAGDVTEASLGPLERLLELALGSGRIGRSHGGNVESSLRRLYGRTPGGRRLVEATDAVNRALRTIAGHRIGEIALSAVGPGRHDVVIDTDGCHLVLAIEPAGVRVREMSVGV